MEKHEKVILNLNHQFHQVDKAFVNNDMRVFGKNTTKIFQDLDVIRRKQIDLASDHVSLEAINDIPPIRMDRDAEYFTQSFEKKKEILKNMMGKLDDLTQAMDRFKKVSSPDDRKAGYLSIK